MKIYVVILIGIALAMDAAGVSLAIGLKEESDEEKSKYILTFGIFQALFTFLGGEVGTYFSRYIASIPSVIGGIALIIVGAMMLISGKKDNEEKGGVNKMIVPLGISVSIDALAIGFTIFNRFNFGTLICYGTIIGLITILLCEFAFIVSRGARKIFFIKKYGEYLGGIILLCFGIKMIIENLI